jgi:hypothetical protein
MNNENFSEIKILSEENLMPLNIEKETTCKMCKKLLDSNVPCTNLSIVIISLYCSLVLCIFLILLLFIGVPWIIENAINSQVT